MESNYIHRKKKNELGFGKHIAVFVIPISLYVFYSSSHKISRKNQSFD